MRFILIPDFSNLKIVNIMWLQIFYGVDVKTCFPTRILDFFLDKIQGLPNCTSSVIFHSAKYHICHILSRSLLHLKDLKPLCVVYQILILAT